ncbi:MAG: hypothetical protein ACO24H_10785 [Polynucleobacter sp.]
MKKRNGSKRRNIIHRHAKLKSGAGVHKNKRAKRVQRLKTRDLVNDEDGIKPKQRRAKKMMTLVEFREEHGIQNGTDMMDALQEWSTDSVVPALCHEGCEVEPDGRCEHDCPSILIRMGVI